MVLRVGTIGAFLPVSFSILEEVLLSIFFFLDWLEVDFFYFTELFLESTERFNDFYWLFSDFLLKLSKFCLVFAPFVLLLTSRLSFEFDFFFVFYTDLLLLFPFDLLFPFFIGFNTINYLSFYSHPKILLTFSRSILLPVRLRGNPAWILSRGRESLLWWWIFSCLYLSIFSLFCSFS